MKKEYLTPKLKHSALVANEYISYDEILGGSFANEWNDVDDKYKNDF